MTPDRERLDQLAVTWRDPPGLRGFLTTVDHKRIAARYIVTALLLMFLAGMLALDMRLQLSVADNTRMGPQLYNESFSLHGSTMLFLVSVPVMEAMALWLVPLMLGTRNMAFPRLGAFSFWLYFGGVLTLWVAHAADITPDLGWFEYPPLSGPAYSPGHRADVWAQMITFTEVAALAASVNVAATILKMRPPGMTLARMPVFLWAMLVASIMTILSMPAIMLVTSMLIADRLVSTHFFVPATGGDVVLFQHLFWFFGHPEVYIIFVPATGFVSSIVETFSRRRLFGHNVIVLSIVSIGALAFGLWVHHMFAVGLPRLGNDFYTAASMAIALPAGLQIFCWIATMGSGRLWLATPMLWILGFVATFVIGGLSGIMTASAALDLQLTDTYFIVAHLHYVLIGGAIFPLFGAFCYWYPKATGRLMSERWGRVAFAMIVGGFNLGFFPMHLLGLMGMPRRVYTYPSGMGWDLLNQVATAGSVIAVAGGLVFVANALVSYWRGAPSGRDPWRGSTLEWASPSPPPPWNLAFTPVVRSLTPMWDDGQRQVMDGIAIDRREMLVTSVMDATPLYRQKSAGPSFWPLLAALAVSAMFIGSIFTPWAIVAGALPIGAALTGWFWPERHRAKTGPLAVRR
ncbi:cbb3-type cytochrome c oxidase subunit I [Sphingomonas aliaeris]|uniref:Cbb3-type cytochrome c oxidase subunit I n=1 Tax=Sphingomonas aliaeris TaxID=2759526 RepID=A0A974NTG6_9SPHN|nr:cbb3-type cytochrome c oxidase subunit I [Sphingomonas aliaeris]QQV76699.1 cbb3-type cytochrome c oxidase subunit I [Sphingomonas aliaeris]